MFNLDRNTVFSSLMGILIISLVINCFTEIYNASVVFPVLGTLVVGGILVFSALFNRIAPFLQLHWIDLMVGAGITCMIVDYLLGNSDLWQLGCLCVLILYCILRLIRKINYVVI